MKYRTCNQTEFFDELSAMEPHDLLIWRDAAVPTTAERAFKHFKQVHAPKGTAFRAVRYEDRFFVVRVA